MTTPSHGERFRTRHALLDVVTPQAGLFRALSDNPAHRRPPRPIIVLHDKVTVEFRAADLLTASDWRLFVAVCALAGLDGKRLPGSDYPDAEGIAATRDALSLTTTAYAVLREAGLTDGGANRRRLTEALTRLAMVRQFLRSGARVVSGANLLSFAVDETTGELGIRLSPQVARSALGESKQHTRLSLEDLRKLSHPAAVIIHAALSSRIRPGTRPSTYRLDTLAALAYGESSNAATRRTRRRAIRPALVELGSLDGWLVEVSGDTATVSRPSRRTKHVLPSD